MKGPTLHGESRKNRMRPSNARAQREGRPDIFSDVPTIPREEKKAQPPPKKTFQEEVFLLTQKIQKIALPELFSEIVRNATHASNTTDSNERDVYLGLCVQGALFYYLYENHPIEAYTFFVSNFFCGLLHVHSVPEKVANLVKSIRAESLDRLLTLTTTMPQCIPDDLYHILEHSSKMTEPMIIDWENQKNVSKPSKTQDPMDAEEDREEELEEPLEIPRREEVPEDSIRTRLTESIRNIYPFRNNASYRTQRREEIPQQPRPVPRNREYPERRSDPEMDELSRLMMNAGNSSRFIEFSGNQISSGELGLYFSTINPHKCLDIQLAVQEIGKRLGSFNVEEIIRSIMKNPALKEGQRKEIKKRLEQKGYVFPENIPEMPTYGMNISEWRAAERSEENLGILATLYAFDGDISKIIPVLEKDSSELFYHQPIEENGKFGFGLFDYADWGVNTFSQFNTLLRTQSLVINESLHAKYPFQGLMTDTERFKIFESFQKGLSEQQKSYIITHIKELAKLKFEERPEKYRNISDEYLQDPERLIREIEEVTAGTQRSYMSEQIASIIGNSNMGDPMSRLVLGVLSPMSYNLLSLLRGGNVLPLITKATILSGMGTAYYHATGLDLFTTLFKNTSMGFFGISYSVFTTFFDVVELFKKFKSEGLNFDSVSKSINLLLKLGGLALYFGFTRWGEQLLGNLDETASWAMTAAILFPVFTCSMYSSHAFYQGIPSLLPNIQKLLRMSIDTIGQDNYVSNFFKKGWIHRIIQGLHTFTMWLQNIYSVVVFKGVDVWKKVLEKIGFKSEYQRGPFQNLLLNVFSRIGLLTGLFVIESFGVIQFAANAIVLLLTPFNFFTSASILRSDDILASIRSVLLSVSLPTNVGVFLPDSYNPLKYFTSKSPWAVLLKSSGLAMFASLFFASVDTIVQYHSIGHRNKRIGATILADAYRRYTGNLANFEGLSTNKRMSLYIRLSTIRQETEKIQVEEYERTPSLRTLRDISESSEKIQELSREEQLLAVQYGPFTQTFSDTSRKTWGIQTARRVMQTAGATLWNGLVMYQISKITGIQHQISKARDPFIVKDFEQSKLDELRTKAIRQDIEMIGEHKNIPSLTAKSREDLFSIHSKPWFIPQEEYEYVYLLSLIEKYGYDEIQEVFKNEMLIASPGKFVVFNTDDILLLSEPGNMKNFEKKISNPVCRGIIRMNSELLESMKNKMNDIQETLKPLEKLYNENLQNLENFKNPKIDMKDVGIAESYRMSNIIKENIETFEKTLPTGSVERFLFDNCMNIPENQDLMEYLEQIENKAKTIIDNISPEISKTRENILSMLDPGESIAVEAYVPLFYTQGQFFFSVYSYFSDIISGVAAKILPFVGF